MRRLIVVLVLLVASTFSLAASAGSPWQPGTRLNTLWTRMKGLESRIDKLHRAYLTEYATRRYSQWAPGGTSWRPGTTLYKLDHQMKRAEARLESTQKAYYVAYARKASHSMRELLSAR